MQIRTQAAGHPELHILKQAEAFTEELLLCSPTCIPAIRAKERECLLMDVDELLLASRSSNSTAQPDRSHDLPLQGSPKRSQDQPGQCSVLQRASYGEDGLALPELLDPALSLSWPICSGTQEPEGKEEWYAYSTPPEQVNC